MDREFWQNRKHRKLLLITVLALVACIGVFTAYQLRQKGAMTNRPAKQQTTVDVLAVKPGDLLKRISLTGQTVPEAQVDIAAKYQGRIVAVYANLGQAVTAGQVLVVQDTGDSNLAIMQNQAAYEQASADAVTSEATFNANYERAKADYERALTAYQRYKTLYDVGGVSKEALDANAQQLADTKATLDVLANQMNGGISAAIQSSRAAALKAQHSVSAATKQRDDLILQAPRAGVIGYRQVEVGSIVSAGQKLLSIVDNSQIYVDCQVAEQDLAALAVGMNVDVQVESLGKIVPGKIIYISPANDPQNQAFSLRIALNSADQAVRSGMFTRTIINAVLRTNTLVVPKDAVLNKNGKTYVYVISADNKVEERIVQLGAGGDDNVEILSGLTPGEQVAVNNLARLSPGMIIKPNIISADSRGAK